MYNQIDTALIEEGSNHRPTDYLVFLWLGKLEESG